MELYNYKAVIGKVTDATNFDAVVDLGFNVQISTPLVLNGISCPKLDADTDAEVAHATKAKEYVETMAQFEEVEIKVWKAKSGDFYLADVFLAYEGQEGKSLTKLLQDNGYRRRPHYED